MSPTRRFSDRASRGNDCAHIINDKEVRILNLSTRISVCFLFLCITVVLLLCGSFTVVRDIRGVLVVYQDATGPTHLVIDVNKSNPVTYDIFATDNRIIQKGGDSDAQRNFLVILDTPPTQSTWVRAHCLYSWTTFIAMKEFGMDNACFASAIEIHGHLQSPAGWIY